jgi:hypothetical protein
MQTAVRMMSACLILSPCSCARYAAIAQSGRCVTIHERQQAREQAMKLRRYPPLPRPTAPLVEMAKAAEAVQDGRICIELINPPILDTRRGRSTLGNECGPPLVDS